MKDELELLNDFADLNRDTQYWLIQIAHELKRAEKKHPAFPEDVIYQAAILAEETGEVVRAAVNVQLEGGAMLEVKKEAIQTGAMAVRLLSNSFFASDIDVSRREASRL